MVILSDELIQHRITARPILPGSSVRGWVLFEVRGDVGEEKPVMIFNDILNRSYSIRLTAIKDIPPLPEEDLRDLQGYPDITKPFRERATIEQMAKRNNLDVLRIRKP